MIFLPKIKRNQKEDELGYQVYTPEEIKKMKFKEIGRIISDGKGTEKPIKSSYFEPDTPEEQIIETPKKKIIVDWRRTFDQIEAMRKLVESHEICQNEGSYKVRLDRRDIPWALAFAFSDAHIGHIGSDHNRTRKLIDGIMSCPNSCLLDDGDTFDTGIWGGLQHEQVIPAYMQAFTVKDMARELGDKFAACVIGNHPEWLWSSAGVKPEVLFAQDIEGPIFPGMGLLHLQAGMQVYDIAMAHNYWGKSKKNIFNVCVNFRNHAYPQADVFIVGHEHIVGAAWEKVDNRTRHYVRPGTGKIDDRWARIHGIARRGQEMGVGILFNTQEHYIETKPIDKAIDFMRGF